MRALAKELTAEGRYAALHFTCEEASVAGDNYGAAMREILFAIRKVANRYLPAELQPPPFPDAPDGQLLSAALERWAATCPRPVVLFFDEVDSLVGQSLISVLRQLRAGFPDRPAHFPWSVILCGIRDVRDYKLAAGGSAPRIGLSSPFNIKVESNRLGDFSLEEVRALYGQHTAETGQIFTEEAGVVEANVTDEPRAFVLPDGRLAFRRLLRAFGRFWREHGAALLSATPYHEVVAQLVFMAFLQRIVNGGGYVDREYGVGRGRLDLLLRWPYRLADGRPAVQRRAIELKVWRPKAVDPLKKGLEQLDGYLSQLGLLRGPHSRLPSWRHCRGPRVQGDRRRVREHRRVYSMRSRRRGDDLDLCPRARARGRSPRPACEVRRTAPAQPRREPRSRRPDGLPGAHPPANAHIPEVAAPAGGR